jgi:hypothetical protein
MSDWLHGRKKKQILMQLMSEAEKTEFLKLFGLGCHTVIEAAETILFCRKYPIVKSIQREIPVRWRYTENLPPWLD